MDLLSKIANGCYAKLQILPRHDGAWKSADVMVRV
jgi:hypothetical protein|tara:strand:+ start:335 stop:439 length:105 start_codon:yes stop_codon:yes gene_type:complete